MKRLRWIFVVVTWFFFSCDTSNVAPGTNTSSENPDGISTEKESGTETDTTVDFVEPVMRKAGFINLMPREIGYVSDETRDRVTGTTHEANIFYALVPADTRPEKMPLMVIFNGGPSAATTGYLFAYGTSPYRIDREDPGQLIKENPHSFSAIANLLYIDTRQTGFSYQLAATAGEATVYREFGDDIAHNAFTDVGDILLTLLAVMENEPALADNPVVLTGESYGGARAALMFGLMSDPSAFFNPNSVYYDPVLGNALKAHFALSMPNKIFEQLTLLEISEQFGWQILLQPGWMLPNRQDYAMGARCNDMPMSDPRYELCNSANRGNGDLRFPYEEPDEMGFVASCAFLHPPAFELFFGVAPETIAGLASAGRERAFRDLPYHRLGIPSTDWLTRMGALGAQDYYYIPLISGPSNGVTEAYLTTAFMRSLAHINTFISYAYYDGMIAVDKIPTALVNANVFIETPLVESAMLDLSTPSDEARPGEMTVVFTEAMALAEDAVTVRMPLYDDSGHSVPLRQAEELRDDISAFLEERGAYH